MRLKRVSDVDAFTKIMQEYVDLGEIEGASARIVHKGKDLYRGCVGCSDVATRRPFGFDDIVCIFSLTKMVIGVAALKLWEQGGFRMDDPVSDYIPAFGNATVYWPTEKGPVIRPARKPVTIRNLFTMTAGYPYPTVGVKPSMPLHYLSVGQIVGDAFEKCRREAERTGEAITTLKAAELLASTPMCFEPGEGWLYGHCSDILGAVVSVISGKSLADFICQEITRPLGMVDTGYLLTPEQRTRVATIYDHFDPDYVKPYDLEAEARDRLLSVPTKEFEICSSSLYSTLDDYSRFIQMLANGGSMDGVRVLGRKTVELMASDQLTAGQYADFKRDWFPNGNMTWGLLTCVSKSMNHSDMVRFPGAFGWSGAAGTVAWADPGENLSITFMTQRFPGDTEPIVSKLMQIAYSMI